MIARLWWKEVRQVGPVWGILALLGLTWQGCVWLYWGDDVDPGQYASLGLLMTGIYLFLIAAAVFAGERENRTLGLLDAIPVERWRVWTAKATFALASTVALGLLLWLGSIITRGIAPEWWEGSKAAVVVGLVALGWGLLWSSLLGNALFAAVLAMASLSASLLLLVNLNAGQINLESTTPWLLILALLTTVASALAFHLGGPPRRTFRRQARPVRPLEVATPEETDAEPRRLARIWTYSVTRLVWETLREARAAVWILVALGAGSLLASAISDTNGEAAGWNWLALGATAIVTGVSVFHGENRERTNRFLLQHGARPGLVWTAKVLIWWAIAALVWSVAGFPLGRLLPTTAPPPESWVTYPRLVYWTACALTIGFATSVLCGMAFRRGITAGMIALIVCLFVYAPIGSLGAAGAFHPSYLVYVALALLAVSWAWSGDWLLDRPGLAKWARLALYSTVAVVGLSSAYIADRVWGVPTLPLAQAERTFQFARIAEPVRDEDNAAPLYREAERQGMMHSMPKLADDSWPWGDLKSVVAGDWNGDEPALAEWLSRVEPSLALLRQAARKPACRYEDLRHQTEFTRTSQPSTYSLLPPMVVSARVRLARGDLSGSWTEIETLLRMSRQYSHEPLPWNYRLIEPLALGLAMRWAADPRQTAETLEAARAAWKAIPAPASEADRVRAAALVFQNTLAIPRDRLADEFFFQYSGGRKKVDPINRLIYDVQTTPWEVARARKVYNLLAAATISDLENNPDAVMDAERSRWPRAWPLLTLDEDGGSKETISTEELEELATFTHLVNQARWSWDRGWGHGQHEVRRRALDLILRLRHWQATHDGALPQSLYEEGMFEKTDDHTVLVDPYAGQGVPPEQLRFRPTQFGYIRSNGQPLLPLGVFDLLSGGLSDPKKIPTDGYMLLYSVGPDQADGRAYRNLDTQGQGDIIFPLKDGVKPPPEAK